MFATRLPSGAVAHVGQGQFSVLLATTCPIMVLVTPLAVMHLRPLALGAFQIVFVADEVPSAPPEHVVELQAVFGP